MEKRGFEEALYISTNRNMNKKIGDVVWAVPAASGVEATLPRMKEKVTIHADHQVIEVPEQ